MKTQATQEKKVSLEIVDVIARYEEKRNGKVTGVVFYTVRPSAKTLERFPDLEPYRVTFFDGRFQGCTCPGYRDWGGPSNPCKHGKGLQVREHPRVEQKPLETSQKGALHGSRPFSLMR